MPRLKNKRYTFTTLAAAATIMADAQGKAGRWPAGSVVMTDQDTGRITVLDPASFTAQTETVAGVLRDKSPLFTAVQATAPATVTPASDGKIQRANPGDWLVTNNATGEVRVYRPNEYVATFE